MAFEGIFIKTEDDCDGLLSESEIKKEKDVDWGATVKLETELALDTDINDAYSTDLPSDSSQQCLPEGATSSEKEAPTFFEKINVKLEQESDDEVNSGPPPWENLEVRTENGPTNPTGSNTGSPKHERDDSVHIKTESETGTTSKNDQSKPFLCSQCPARYKTRKGLKTHSLFHSNEKPFACYVCPKRFKSNGGLKHHLLSHSEKKQFSCKACSAKFKTSQELERHAVKHIGKKAYTCDVCSARFETYGGLKFHSLYHSGEKSFSCYMCPITLNDRYELAQHIATHFVE